MGDICSKILINIYNLYWKIDVQFYFWTCSTTEKSKVWYEIFTRKNIYKNCTVKNVSDCMGKRITGFWFKQNVWQELDVQWMNEWMQVPLLKTFGIKNKYKAAK